MWIRSGHRAHGLDTYIYIYICIHIFGEYKIYYMTSQLFGNPSSRLSMFLCSEVVKYILTRRGGSKSYNMNHSQRAGFSDFELPGKFVENHANMFADALTFVCLFVCWNKTRKKILRLLCWEGSSPPGSDHTREEAQTASRNIFPAGNVHSIDFFFFWF